MGSRVVLNPTSIADNDVYLSATSPGGLSLVADADVPDALNAVSVVTSSGIGDLDAVALDTALSGASIELYPSIDQTSENFVGSSTTDDLELLLQMVNLYMSAPRFDPVALDSTVETLQAYVDDPNSDPDLAEYIAYTDARFGSEPRYRVIPDTRGAHRARPRRDRARVARPVCQRRRLGVRPVRRLRPRRGDRPGSAILRIAGRQRRDPSSTWTSNPMPRRASSPRRCMPARATRAR